MDRESVRIGDGRKAPRIHSPSTLRPLSLEFAETSHKGTNVVLMHRVYDANGQDKVKTVFIHSFEGEFAPLDIRPGWGSRRYRRKIYGSGSDRNHSFCSGLRQLRQCFKINERI